MKKPVLMSWSTGKDSALALYRLQQHEAVEVVGLVTTLSTPYDRVGLHGIRRSLLEAQAHALQLPLYPIFLPACHSEQEYWERLLIELKPLCHKISNTIAYGDLYLEDLKETRVTQLASIGMEPLFPLWHEPTDRLAQDLLSLNFKAITTAVDSQVLDHSFVGRPLDASFFQALPSTVDPCGENGEFHSFVFDGPIFSHPIPLSMGETVFKPPFYYCDLRLEEENT